MEPARILVVDDDPLTLKLLAKALSLAGYEVVMAESGAQALEHLTGALFDAAVVDLRMPEMGGLELLREIKRQDPSIEVVMTTAYPEVSTAVEALKHGAYDYLQKPLNLDELRQRMARAVEHRFLRGQVRTLRSRLGERLAVKELVAVSPSMTRLKELIGQVAGTDSPVLIEGESGTGKELVAAAIHRSARGHEPFIPVNCGAIPSDLMEGPRRPAAAHHHRRRLGRRNRDPGPRGRDRLLRLEADQRPPSPCRGGQGAGGWGTRGPEGRAEEGHR